MSAVILQFCSHKQKSASSPLEKVSQKPSKAKMHSTKKKPKEAKIFFFDGVRIEYYEHSSYKQA